MANYWFTVTLIAIIAFLGFWGAFVLGFFLPLIIVAGIPVLAGATLIKGAKSEFREFQRRRA